MEFELWENEAIDAFFLSYKPEPTASVKTEVFDSEEERESVIKEIEEDYRAWLAA